METRLDIYSGLVVALATVCYCYGLYWVIEPMVANGDPWLTILIVSSIVFLAISLGLMVLAFCLGPFLAVVFFAVEGLFRAALWIIRRIRGGSAHPLP